MEKLKLTKLRKESLSNSEMNLLGGGRCGCSCYYEGNTGSSKVDNMGANYDGSLHSKKGLNNECG
ncbi:MAG: TIGR04149 family rSAM-modified RiPP [Marinifilaceae bacterium]